MRPLGPAFGQRRVETVGVGLPRQPGDLAVAQFGDHPAAVPTPSHVHREEPAPHGGGDPGEVAETCRAIKGSRFWPELRLRVFGSKKPDAEFYRIGLHCSPRL